MNDSVGFSDRNGDEFQHSSVSVRTNNEQAVFPSIVVFDQANCVLPRMIDVRIGNSVFAGCRTDLHVSII